MSRHIIGGYFTGKDDSMHSLGSSRFLIANKESNRHDRFFFIAIFLTPYLRSPIIRHAK